MMSDEVYDQMLDAVNAVEAAKDRGVDVSGIVAKARIRMEIDLSKLEAIQYGLKHMEAGDIEEAAKICAKYGNYIDRLKNDLEEHGKREYSDMVREEAL